MCISPIGGFNVGDDYLGLGKLGYWRDTHFRIAGDAVDGNVYLSNNLIYLNQDNHHRR
jgi:phosphatidylserine/phosphatidylglycerophosphate/cardiolipin synthase-like enzyme